MKKEEKTLFIWLLEYGERMHDRQVSCHDMLNDAVDARLWNGNTSVGSVPQTLSGLYFECFNVDAHTRANVPPTVDRGHWTFNKPSHLKAEYYFRLLEFRELQLARETAERANVNSIKAQKNADKSIKIAVVAVLASVAVAIFTTAWQLSSTIQIDPQQLQRLEAAVSRPVLIPVAQPTQTTPQPTASASAGAETVQNSPQSTASAAPPSS